MDSLPLVSIICLCYNQKAFVGQAIRSVRAQTYQNIELILVDDGSTDGSKDEIRELLAGTETRFIDLPKNIGNCAAFNQGYRASKGEYLIDLAADDLLLPTRVELGVRDFSQGAHNAGVHFCDAFLIKENGQTMGTHYSRNSEGRIIEQIPTGYIYQSLISRYFICPPTMMFRRSVLDALGGYDESLHYEDFDFWIRSGREFQYIFQPAPLVKKRLVKHSHSRRQSAFRSPHLSSTLRVCEKIYDLNKTDEEDRALLKRCQYEVGQCLKCFRIELIPAYLRLAQKTQRRLSSSSSMER